MKFSPEIRDKIKTSIKDKLIEINAYVDDELPEYIVVLASHRKPRTSIIEDLKLFLGRNTEKFVDWLNAILEQLEIQSNEYKSRNLASGRIDAHEEEVLVSEGEYFSDEYDSDPEIPDLCQSKKDTPCVESFIDELSTNPIKRTVEIVRPPIFKRVVINRTNFDGSSDTNDTRPVHVIFNSDINTIDQSGENTSKGGLETDTPVTKLNERCKFWPSCINGDKCQFHHPNVVCRTFPNCKFADKCMYIHPNCMFDASCSRPNCPYTHTTKNTNYVPRGMSKPLRGRRIRSRGMTRFQRPYSRVKMCQFGSKCTNREQCHFYHPITKSTLYKWKRPVDSIPPDSVNVTDAGCNSAKLNPPAE